MRRPILSRLAPLTAVLALAACGDATTTGPDEPSLAASNAAPFYLVTFTDDVTDVRGTAQAMARANGFVLHSVREFAARGFTAAVPESRLESLRSDPRILILEKDGPVSLIKPVESFARPGGGSGGQTTPWGITRVGGPGDGTGKTAWIIDSGIDLNHPDLNTSRNCHAYFTGTSPEDGNGHGTHVAGTIGAIDNGIGVVGVAANAYVCAVRVLGASGSGSWSGVTNGVNYVAANGANGDVANMSLGGSGSNATLEKAISDAAAKGIKFAIAAGNDGANAANYTPARVNGANIVTISAIASNDCMPSWSNWGNPPVDWAAPGSGINSTYKGDTYKSLSGTSMAAPHAAGVLLLGSARQSGSAKCDPDGNADPIISR